MGGGGRRAWEGGRRGEREKGQVLEKSDDTRPRRLSLYESFITAYSALRNPRSQSADLPPEMPVRFQTL